LRRSVASLRCRGRDEEEKWHGATIKDLNLPSAVTIEPTATCVQAADVMRVRGFDQLPVVNAQGAIMGLVTEGHLLARLARRLVEPGDPVAHSMMRFSRKKKFEPITAATPLHELSRFFERNSFAFVTEESATGVHVIRSVVTKIDLIHYLLRSSSLLLPATAGAPTSATASSTSAMAPTASPSTKGTPSKSSLQ
jgi:cystathionine beta-synthase